MEKTLTAAFLTSAQLVLSENNTDRFCSQKAFRQQLYTLGTQHRADRSISSTEEIFRLPLNSSAVLWVQKEAVIQIHDDGRDRAPDPFGNNLQQLDTLSFFFCQRLEPWQQKLSWEQVHNPFPCTDCGQVLFTGWLWHTESCLCWACHGKETL